MGFCMQSAGRAGVYLFVVEQSDEFTRGIVSFGRGEDCKTELVWFSPYLGISKVSNRLSHDVTFCDVSDVCRVFFVVLRMVLGILLLSDISFKSTYPEIHAFPVQRAGLSPLNSSLVNFPNFNVTATTEFWWYFPALLTDVKRVRGVAPLNCTGADDECLSYFVPGSMADISLDPSQPVLAANQFPRATAYMQIDAPGYQLDFKRIDRVNDPYMTLLDCHVYGIPQVAIQVCLKENGNELLAGATPRPFVFYHRLRRSGLTLLAWNACPGDVGSLFSCLNTTDWRTIVPFNTKVSISQRRATTVFDRLNSSIIDILDLSPPTPMNYTAANFFALYDQVFAIPFGQQWNISTQYFFTLGIQQFLSTPSGTENGTGNDMQLSRLQDFLATPVFLFNNVVYYQQGGPTPDMGTQAALAYPSYRVPSHETPLCLMLRLWGISG